MKTQTERPKKEFGYLKPRDIGFHLYGAFYSVNVDFGLLRHAICMRLGCGANGALEYSCQNDFGYAVQVVLVEDKYAKMIINRLVRLGWKISHEVL